MPARQFRCGALLLETAEDLDNPTGRLVRENERHWRSEENIGRQRVRICQAVRARGARLPD